MRAAWVIVEGALGCATSTPAPPPPRITVSEPGGQVTLAVGQELALQLEAHVTTGYAWELVPPVPDLLTVTDPGTYRASSGSEPRVGAGGTTSFQLVYRRPWERDVAPTRTVRVDVDVR
jgi:inhibitor of cysteine peptidase